MKNEENDIPFLPDWYSPPGDTILDWMEIKNISKEEFSNSMEFTLEEIEELLIGNMIIDEFVAQKLVDVIGSTVNFWMTRESQYREAFERWKKKRELES